MKVTLLMAQTLDGRIAKDSHHFPDWTEPEDKTLFARITRQAGVLIMGRKSYDVIGKPLPGRLNVILSRKQHESEHENLIYTNKVPKVILEDLAAQGHNHVILAGGMMTNSLFAQEGLIDEIIVTVSPLVMGEGLNMFNPDIELDLKLESTEPLGHNSLCLTYTVIK